MTRCVFRIRIPCVPLVCLEVGFYCAEISRPADSTICLQGNAVFTGSAGIGNTYRTRHRCIAAPQYMDCHIRCLAQRPTLNTDRRHIDCVGLHVLSARAAPSFSCMHHAKAHHLEGTQEVRQLSSTPNPRRVTPSTVSFPRHRSSSP